MHENLNNIGANIHTADFARMCGTSKRTLIHYEDIGLFLPARRDENGYRYYSEQQYELFQVIDSLKALGMPLSEIKVYLERRDPAELGKLLDFQARQVEAELEKLERIRRIIRTKRSLLEEGERVVCGEPEIVEMEQEYLILSDPVADAEYASVSKILCRHLTACGRSPWQSGHPFGAMIAAEDILRGNVSRYAYFFTKVESNIPESSFVKPAGRYAVTYLQGDYRRPHQAYRQLLQYIADCGLQPCGYSYKEGIIDEVAAQDSEQFITRISIQIRG